MLHVIQTQPEINPAQPAQLEDELIRSGARGAHLLDDGTIAVTIAARTLDDAVVLAQDLIARVRRRVFETSNAPLAGATPETSMRASSAS